MTNEQKAARLEELAEDCRLALPDAALLRESAALWRERDGVRWEEWGTGSATVYKRRFVYIEQWKGVKDRRFRWDVNEAGSEYLGDAFGYAPTLDAAKAAAVAWVDAQEDL